MNALTLSWIYTATSFAELTARGVSLGLLQAAIKYILRTRSMMDSLHKRKTRAYWCLWLVAMAIVITPAARAADVQCMNASPCQLMCSGACTKGEAAVPGASVTDAHGRGVIAESAASKASTASSDAQTMQDLIDTVVAAAEAQALSTTEKLQPSDGYPDVTLSTGEWKVAAPGKWVSGFFAGVLWQLHSLTGKQQWQDLAQKWQADLADRQRGWIAQRDLGFIYLPTFAHSYSVTNSTEDLRQALAAAEALSWAFNPDTGTVEAWQGWLPRGATNMYKQLVIIDFMINVQMLLWGAKHVGPPNAASALRMDTDPAATWRDMAIRHGRATAKNHVRADGTTYHVVEYNPENRPPFINKRYTYQGYADESAWARGQSWALLGFAQMYAETGMPEFLDTARKVSDKWLDLLATQPGAPGDFVPVWDFRAPFSADRDGPRDSSAAGIASLALLTLAEAVGVDSACGQRYLCAAVRTLQSLASPKYMAQPGEAFSALFKHAVSNFPDNYGVDVGIIYGDYYGLSAFTKCASMAACRNYRL